MLINIDICPYCGGHTEYVDSIEVYGTSYGMIYLCRPCKAYVGVHKGTDTPLGILADSKTREARKKAHAYFDTISKTGRINKIWKEYLPNTSNRNKAYQWLAKQMNISVENCHIGMFTVDQCNQVVKICRKQGIKTFLK